MSEALIFESTNPQYDNRLFNELPVQYMKIPSSEHSQNMCCAQIVFLFWHSEQFMYTTCSELGIFMYWTGNSMDNLLSYCGLVDARISTSEKDLPVLSKLFDWLIYELFDPSGPPIYCALWFWALLRQVTFPLWPEFKHFVQKLLMKYIWICQFSIFYFVGYGKN